MVLIWRHQEGGEGYYRCLGVEARDAYEHPNAQDSLYNKE